MTSFLSDTESDALSAIILVAFCSSLTWDEKKKTLNVTFPNRSEESFFLGDDSKVLTLIRQAAIIRNLPIGII